MYTASPQHAGNTALELHSAERYTSYGVDSGF